nr:retrovirus-related Pol polyprotein from transposon TNT 1-94 [Tanacetum cinerariifolium]
NGTEFVNQTLRDYYEKVGISHESLVARSPQQNRVVKRRNRTLIEAARTMLIYAQAPLFLWAEAVATACYTHNRSIICLRHGKTPYELLHSPKAIAPIDEVIPLVNADSTGSPSFTMVEQDAPSTSNSSTPTETQSIIIPQDVRDDNLDMEVAHIGSDSLEELHEFDRLAVWELVPRPDKVMVTTLKWIYKVKLDELGGILKNKAHLVTRGYRQEEGIDFEESFAPHIDIGYHFIKEQVENRVIELYFVYTEYQLADLFTKALGRDRIEFLTNKLGMRSFTPEMLKKLMNDEDE